MGAAILERVPPPAPPPAAAQEGVWSRADAPPPRGSRSWRGPDSMAAVARLPERGLLRALRGSVLPGAVGSGSAGCRCPLGGIPGLLWGREGRETGASAAVAGGLEPRPRRPPCAWRAGGGRAGASTWAPSWPPLPGSPTPRRVWESRPSTASSGPRPCCRSYPKDLARSALFVCKIAPVY